MKLYYLFCVGICCGAIRGVTFFGSIFIAETFLSFRSASFVNLMCCMTNSNSYQAACLLPASEHANQSLLASNVNPIVVPIFSLLRT